MGIKIHISLHFGMDNFVRFLLIPSTCSSFVRMLEGYLWVSRTEMESFTELAREFHPTFRDTEGIVTSHVEKMFPAETCVRALSLHTCIVRKFALFLQKRKKKENGRKVEHAINAGDGCSHSFARGLPQLEFPSFSIRFVENHDAFYPSPIINPVLIARITCDDRAVIFAIP